jgi:L-ascorbate metabolism protein UlaG (beta-lactamase superfamily)
VKITMIGHSTVLIESNGQKIVTDPYFGTRGHIAYKRLAPPARTREALQDVDAVLVSHNHWDHTDSRYLQLLPDHVPVLAPQRMAWALRLRGARNVVGLNPWQSHSLEGIAATAVPALHVTVAVGYVIQAGNRQVYFAGDTYYRPFMAEIGKRFRLDAALIPVTTFRIPMTMGAKGAVRAVQALNPAAVLPIHLAVMPRSPLLCTGDTPQGFERRLRQAGLETPVVLLREGASWTA